MAAVYAVAPHREAKRLQAKGLLQEIRQEASTMDEKGVSLQPGRKEQKEEDNNDNNDNNNNNARTTDCSTKIADEEKMFQEISQKVQEICDKMRLLVGASVFLKIYPTCISFIHWLWMTSTVSNIYMWRSKLLCVLC